MENKKSNSKNIILVRTRYGMIYGRKIKEYLAKRGFTCYDVMPKNILGLIKSKQFNTKNTLIHARTSNPKHIFHLFKNLEEKGFVVINPADAIRRSSDKYLAMHFAKKSNIPAPHSLKIRKANITASIKKSLKKSNKVVIKPIVSKGHGRYCYLIKKNDSAEAIRKKARKIPGNYFIIQEFIDYNKLYRVVLIDFKPIKDAVTYDEKSNSWKCSVCLNPKIKLDTNPPSELLKIAKYTAKSFNAPIAFIDFFNVKNRFIFNEINTACNLHYQEKASKIPIHKLIGEYLIKVFEKKVND